MAHMQELCGHTFREELQDTYLANDTWGMVVHRMTAKRNGKTLDGAAPFLCKFC
jgi:hypothetical protein